MQVPCNHDVFVYLDISLHCSDRRAWLGAAHGAGLAEASFFLFLLFLLLALLGPSR